MMNRGCLLPTSIDVLDRHGVTEAGNLDMNLI